MVKIVFMTCIYELPQMKSSINCFLNLLLQAEDQHFWTGTFICISYAGHRWRAPSTAFWSGSPPSTSSSSSPPSSCLDCQGDCISMYLSKMQIVFFPILQIVFFPILQIVFVQYCKMCSSSSSLLSSCLGCQGDHYTKLVAVCKKKHCKLSFLPSFVFFVFSSFLSLKSHSIQMYHHQTNKHQLIHVFIWIKWYHIS